MNKLVTEVALTPTAETVETNVEVGFVVDVYAAATGSVEFFEGTSSLSTVPVEAGSAVLRTTFTDAGTRSVTAVYSGDETYAAAIFEAAAVKVTAPAPAEHNTKPATPAKPTPGLAGTGMADFFGLILLSSGLVVLGLLAAAGALLSGRRLQQYRRRYRKGGARVFGPCPALVVFGARAAYPAARSPRQTCRRFQTFRFAHPRQSHMLVATL